MALASTIRTRHHSPVRHAGLSIAIAGVLALAVSGCTHDEESQEACGDGAKCAPMSVVDSKSLGLMCMTVAPRASTVGAVVDGAAAIDFNGRRTLTVARAALVQGKVVAGFYILSPAQPTCSQPKPGTPASAVAYDRSAYSASTLDQLLGG
ncbi:MAG: hypothetical protein JWL72_4334 [Ilumatobacteraceae bacterium]|nr:hypothetical protein [Ilumatobacteraceae bacterium]